MFPDHWKIKSARYASKHGKIFYIWNNPSLYMKSDTGIY